MASTKRKGDYHIRLLEQQAGWRPVNYSKRILVPDTRIAVASDVHIPYHDPYLVAEFLDRCKDLGVTAIVWLGDLLDMPTFSSWPQTDHTTRYERESGMARGLLEMAAEVVDAQYWSLGNHEERLFRTVKYQLGMEQLALSLGLGDLVGDDKLILSDNPTLDTATDLTGKATWMLTHPAKYGKQPLIVPGKLATRFGQNVMSAHAHHWAIGTDETGQYTVVETGGLFNPDLFEYTNYRVTDHRAWVSGYWFLLDGEPVGFRKGHNHAFR